VGVPAQAGPAPAHCRVPQEEGLLREGHGSPGCHHRPFRVRPRPGHPGEAQGNAAETAAGLRPDVGVHLSPGEADEGGRIRGERAPLLGVGRHLRLGPGDALGGNPGPVEDLRRGPCHAHLPDGGQPAPGGLPAGDPPGDGRPCGGGAKGHPEGAGDLRVSGTPVGETAIIDGRRPSRAAECPQGLDITKFC